MQFGIFVFEEALETNLQDNFQGCKCDGDCIVLWKHFSFYEKVPSSLDLVGFFEICLPQPPVWCFQLIFIIQYAVCKNIFACLFSVHNTVSLSYHE